MPEDRRDPSNDPFLADLIAGFDPAAPPAVPTSDTGCGLAIRRDAEVIVVQAWHAGPAGVASLDLDQGITVVVDAALPHRIAGATVVPADTGALRRLDPLFGTRAVDALVDAGDTAGAWRPVLARPRETSESTASGRYVLLADEAARFRKAYPGALARVALLIELAGAVPSSLSAMLADRLLVWARGAAEAVVELEDTGRLVIPTEAGARRLARALREVEATVDQLSVRGTNPLADRRFARQLTPLADRIEEGRYVPVTEEDPAGDAEGPRASPTVQIDDDAGPALVGRAACRSERRGDQTGAARLWSRCAEGWDAAGDDERAAVARLFATGSLGNAAPVATQPGDGSTREDLVRVRSRKSTPARFGWLRNREAGPERERPEIRRRRHDLGERQQVDRFTYLTPFLADELS